MQLPGSYHACLQWGRSREGPVWHLQREPAPPSQVSAFVSSWGLTSVNYANAI